MLVMMMYTLVLLNSREHTPLLDTTRRIPLLRVSNHPFPSLPFTSVINLLLPFLLFPSWFLLSTYYSLIINILIATSLMYTISRAISDLRNVLSLLYVLTLLCQMSCWVWVQEGKQKR